MREERKRALESSQGCLEVNSIIKRPRKEHYMRNEMTGGASRL
jgi:hypothetical protein